MSASLTGRSLLIALAAPTRVDPLGATPLSLRPQWSDHLTDAPVAALGDTGTLRLLGVRPRADRLAPHHLRLRPSPLFSQVAAIAASYCTVMYHRYS
jgi:hypothetical protein